MQTRLSTTDDRIDTRFRIPHRRKMSQEAINKSLVHWCRIGLIVASLGRVKSAAVGGAISTKTCGCWTGEMLRRKEKVDGQSFGVGLQCRWQLLSNRKKVGKMEQKWILMTFDGMRNDC